MISLTKIHMYKLMIGFGRKAALNIKSLCQQERFKFHNENLKVVYVWCCAMYCKERIIKDCFLILQVHSHTVNEYGLGYPSIMEIEFTYGLRISS